MSARKELELVIQEEIEQEDIPFVGNAMASGDSEVDRETEEWIRSELEQGNQAAWCQVVVHAKFFYGPYPGEEVASGMDSLGGSSYASERELWRDLGPGMRENATREAVEGLLRTVHTPRRPTHGPTDRNWIRGLSGALARWLQRHPHWAVYADRWLEAHV